MSTELLLDQVNQLRLDEDLTYAELGEQIGIDGGALHRILKRQSEPLDRTLFKIRRYMEQRVAKPSTRAPRRAKGRAA